MPKPVLHLYSFVKNPSFYFYQSLNRSHKLDLNKLEKPYLDARMKRMSDREVTRWQHNRIYCEYKNDLICHLQIFIQIKILR